MNKTKVVSFDVDGTLVDRKFVDIIWDEAVPELYAKEKGIGLEEAKEYIKKEYDKVGDKKVEWYDIKYWFKHFGINKNWKELLMEFKNEIEIYPDVMNILDELSKKYKLIIISNASKEFLDIEVEKFKHYFAYIFSSTSDFKQLKKTANFYFSICSILGVKPHEIVHVGDNWDFDFIAPRKIGIKTFYLDRIGQKQGDSVIHDLMELKYKL